MLSFPDGTPFYIDGTIPISLAYKRDFSFDASVTNPMVLEPNTGMPYLYFIRFNEPYSWGYQYPGSGSVAGRHVIDVGAYNGGVVSGRLYCFGAVPQTVPAFGLAVWNAQGQCILTHETVTLKGLNRTGASGNQGAATYLNETIAGRKAIAPGRTGIIIYSQMVGGHIITALEPHATACWLEGGNTRVVAVPTTRSRQTIAINSSTGNNYRPIYIDCNDYD
ncbi:hypothetical protein [Pantoea agglomerans]|uniref:hypothetical protein n=1 Tax=Enterobacter agglomerans TaxID=549 RepID=UPI001781B518|nr:hypothetical protein [Pantoea agglomerans]MBD8153312.1 hypothetical protein [Pantoea agglomerans]